MRVCVVGGLRREHCRCAAVRQRQARRTTIAPACSRDSECCRLAADPTPQSTFPHLADYAAGEIHVRGGANAKKTVEKMERKMEAAPPSTQERDRQRGAEKDIWRKDIWRGITGKAERWKERVMER